MNKVILMGRLTHEPELKNTPNGIAVMRFSLAVRRRFAKENEKATDFINCVAWRQTAEFIAKYFHKGSMIGICGNIQTRSWDGDDGKKHYATEVIAEEVYFTGEKSTAVNQGDAFTDAGFSDVDVGTGEDDLPF